MKETEKSTTHTKHTPHRSWFDIMEEVREKVKQQSFMVEIVEEIPKENYMKANT